ncbi:hypothetical protein FGM00_19105 [Aggregatimonas sangjinii]|uniref:DUF4097 domain-containing protein n=1 Tax=Aggregatimonas sangjinii TaxID=2583587 RepID=A0A5B7SZC8_9FLAO|nr:DUF4097 family beta strand repeat-containing protein [Aggregatimonas sangjinii]QCX02120.1 hypothetical protein FGM00_19105 [Aggregatimonas sangjinii]
MKTPFILIFLLSLSIGVSQTLVEKTIVDSSILFIEIDAANCYAIAMETTEGNEMRIMAEMDGEYHSDLVLKVREEGNTLQVGAGFQPNFRKPNDKLSAHKVVSIALQLILPKNKRVVLNGTSCNISAKGSYLNLAVALNDGQCVLENISEEVTVRTQSGDILVKSDGATISAESKYGNVGTNKIPEGNNRYVLKTVTGNIRFSEME